MKYINWLFAILLLFHYPLFSQQPLTLEACIQSAKTHSPIAGKISIINQSVLNRNKLIKLDNYPKLVANGQATWQSDVTKVPIELPNVMISSPPTEQYKITLDANQSLWDGGLKKFKKARNEANSNVEQQQVSVELYQVEKQVSQLFFNVLLMDRNAETALILKQTLAAQISKLHAAVENGTAIPSDVQNLEARMLTIDQHIQEIEIKKSASLEGLRLLTGQAIPNSQPFKVPRFDQNTSKEINRPELLLFDARQALINTSEKMIKAKTNPKFRLFAQSGYGNPGLNFLGGGADFFVILGVGVQIPLDHLYLKTSRLESQQIQIEKSLIDQQKEQFRLMTHLQGTQLSGEIDRLKNLLITDQKIINLREDIRKVAETQLENGVITTADYLAEFNKEEEAKKNKNLHEIQLIQTLYEWNYLYN